MSPYLAGGLVVVGLVLVLAYLSDRRDRKNHVDPKLRVAALQERRRQARQRRVRAFSRRTGRDAADAPEAKPWER